MAPSSPLEPLRCIGDQRPLRLLATSCTMTIDICRKRQTTSHCALKSLWKIFLLAIFSFSAYIFDSGVAHLSPLVTAHNTSDSCPREYRGKGYDPANLANLASELLLPMGHIKEAIACTKKALKKAQKMSAYPEPAMQAMTDNLNNFQMILTPKRDMSVKRFFHNLGTNRGTGFPENSSDPLTTDRLDTSIKVWDKALTAEQCENITRLFDQSNHYDGNVMTGGEIKVDISHKKAKEYDISGSAPDEPDWAAIDNLLVAVTYRHIHLYEEENPAVRLSKNPFGDDGFTIRKYKNDGTEHHAYHIDGGQEAACWPRRIIAILIYLNDVEEGGETVFLNQGLAVQPKCGRVLFFPTAFTHIHAGRRPVSNPKYLITNFLTVL